MERLQKYLAPGIASRRASSLIEAGRVTSTASSRARLRWIRRRHRAPRREAGGGGGAVYLLLNKPPNTVTTAKDTHGRRTVLDCLQGLAARVFPVGRLDLDVGGVLLLTDDGELANRLIHPRYQIPKVYLAWVWGRVGDDAIARLEAGVELEDGVTAPAKARVMKHTAKQSLIRLQIHEGKKREVKRMCKAVGHPVASLVRVEFGGIRVGDLKPGEWRHLTEEEVGMLRRKTGL